MDRDLKYIKEGINQFMPKFELTTKQLLNPDSKMVFAFYKTFINNVNYKYAQITNQINNYQPINFDYEFKYCLNIFKEVQRFYESNDVEFTINDIVRPSKKRTLSNFLLAISYLSYIDGLVPKTLNILDNIQHQQDQEKILELENENLKKEVENLVQLQGRQSYHLETAKNEFAANEKIFNELRISDVKKQSELEEKKLLLEQLEEKFKMKKSILKDYENKEKIILQQNFSQEEYKTLVQTEAYLKKELEQFDIEEKEVTQVLMEKTNLLKKYEAIQSILDKINIDSLKIFEEVKEQDNLISEYNNRLRQLEQFQMQNVSLKRSIQETEKNLKKLIENHKKEKDKLLKEVKSHKNRLEMISTKQEANLKQKKKLFHLIQEESLKCGVLEMEVSEVNFLVTEVFEFICRKQKEIIDKLSF